VHLRAARGRTELLQGLDRLACRPTGQQFHLDANAPARRTGREGPTESQEGSVAFALWRQRSNDRVVFIDQANFACATRRTHAIEELDVGCGVLLPLLGNVVFVVDRFNRADRFAGAAINTLIGLDVEHAVALVDAVNWALFDAGLVLKVDARLRDDVGHGT
jgi:hypothetical protein